MTIAELHAQLQALIAAGRGDCKVVVYDNDPIGFSQWLPMSTAEFDERLDKLKLQ